MTLIAHDWEFLEDGKLIHPISVGLVADDGREYYAVFEDTPRARIVQNDWLLQNVWKNLPVKGMQIVEYTADGKTQRTVAVPGELDQDSPFVKPKRIIRNEVRAFILGGESPAELWADYGAYDHVALAQLFGRMIDLPDGIPMHTNDVQTLMRLMLADEAVQVGTSHNALDDARTVMNVLKYVFQPQQEVISEERLDEVFRDKPPSSKDIVDAAVDPNHL